MGFGAYTNSSTFQATRQRAAGIFALLAILLHVVVPTLYDLSGPATRGLMQTTICAGGEMMEIYLDADGKPVKPAPVDRHDCTSCVSHCAALAIAVFSTDAPRWLAAFVTPALPATVFSYFLASVHPRGPPA